MIKGGRPFAGRSFFVQKTTHVCKKCRFDIEKCEKVCYNSGEDEVRKMKRLLSLLLIGCILLATGLLAACDDAPNGEIARITFLDVGQGDCVLIRTTWGNILIDAGTEDAEEMLVRRLEDLGVETLELAVFTHPDEDHVGGADGVLKRIPTKRIWLPQTAKTVENESYAQLLSVANSRGIAVEYVQAGELLRLGEVRLFTLAPLRESTTDSNEGSIVLKLICGRATALFTGDVGEKTEKELVACYGASQLSCSLYKVGHHGSSTSTSDALLEAMRPTWAVVCCGLDNPYGHPHGEVLERLAEKGITVYRTDLSGEISFSCDGERFALMED